MSKKLGLVHILLLICSVAAVSALPIVADNYYLRFFTQTAMYAVLALSWNLIGGYAGYPSFATAAFFGLGAYLGAITQNAGLPMPGAWVIAILGTAAFAAGLGYAVLRLRGHYFAVGSIVVVELLRQIASTWRDVTGGGMGLNVPIFPGGPDYASRVFFYAMLALAVITLLVTLVVDRSRLGFGLRCIQQNEDAAEMVGVNTERYKSIAFTLSGMFCGGAGAIYASWVSYIDPSDVFNILTTLKVPVMALLGGAGTVYGPIVGVVSFQLLEESIWANFLDFHNAVLGVIIVVLVFFLPGGLLRVNYKKGLARLGLVRKSTSPPEERR